MSSQETNGYQETISPPSRDRPQAEKMTNFGFEANGGSLGMEKVVRMPLAENDHFQIQENTSWQKGLGSNFMAGPEKNTNFHNSISQIAQKFETTFKRTDSLMERIDRVMKSGGSSSQNVGECLIKSSGVYGLSAAIPTNEQKEMAKNPGETKETPLSQPIGSGNAYLSKFTLTNEGNHMGLQSSVKEYQQERQNSLSRDIVGSIGSYGDHRGIAFEEKAKTSLEMPYGNGDRIMNGINGKYPEGQRQYEKSGITEGISNRNLDYSQNIGNVREYQPLNKANEPRSCPSKINDCPVDERGQMRPQDSFGNGLQMPRPASDYRDKMHEPPRQDRLTFQESQYNPIYQNNLPPPMSPQIGEFGPARQKSYEPLNPESQFVPNYYRSIPSKFDENKIESFYPVSYSKSHQYNESQDYTRGLSQNVQNRFYDQIQPQKNLNSHGEFGQYNQRVPKMDFYQNDLHSYHPAFHIHNSEIREETRNFQHNEFNHRPVERFEKEIYQKKGTSFNGHRSMGSVREPQQHLMHPKSQTMFLKEIPLDEEESEEIEPPKTSQKRIRRPPASSKRPPVYSKEKRLEENMGSGVQFIRFSDFKSSNSTKSVRSSTPEVKKMKMQKQQEPQRDPDEVSYLSIREGYQQSSKCPSLPRKSGNFIPEVLRNKSNSNSQSRERSTGHRTECLTLGSQSNATLRSKDYPKNYRLVEEPEDPRMPIGRIAHHEPVRRQRSEYREVERNEDYFEEGLEEEEASYHGSRNPRKYPAVFRERSIEEKEGYSHGGRESQGYKDDLNSEHYVDERMLAERIQRAVAFQPKFSNKSRPSSGTKAKEQPKISKPMPVDKSEGKYFNQSLGSSGKKPPAVSAPKPKRHSSLDNLKSDLDNRLTKALGIPEKGVEKVIIHEEQKKMSQEFKNNQEKRRKNSQNEREEHLDQSIKQTPIKTEPQSHNGSAKGSSGQEAKMGNNRVLSQKSRDGMPRVEDFSESTRRLLREADRALHSPTLPTLRVVGFHDDPEEPEIVQLTQLKKQAANKSQEMEHRLPSKTVNFSNMRLQKVMPTEDSDQKTSSSTLTSHFTAGDHEKKPLKKATENIGPQTREKEKPEIKISKPESKEIALHSNKPLEKYIGSTNNGSREGYGVLQAELDGRLIKIYEGEWQKNLFHGRGTLFASGMKQKKSGAKSQKVEYQDLKEIDEFVERYEGDFEEGRKNGLGTLFFTNGAKYSGQFIDDCINGFGTWTESDGSKVIGEWEEGLFVGAL